MKRALMTGLLLFRISITAHAQGRTDDWPMYGGDAQRTGWEKSDFRITKDNVKDFQLVMKRKLDNKLKGLRALTPPVVIGMLISYRGFKELAFVAGETDNFWSIDADLDRIFWQKHFETTGAKQRSAACAASVTPSLVPPANFAAGRPRTDVPKPALGFLSPAHFGEPRPVFTMSSDGKLHILNTATGDDLIAPMAFLPSGAKASTLTFSNGVMYTTTSGNCVHVPDGVWALDMNQASVGRPGVVAHYAVESGSLPATGGLAVAADGTIYAAAGSDLLALAPSDLKLKQTFHAPSSSGGKAAPGITPVIFRYKEHEMIAAAVGDGRISLWDGEQKMPVAQSPAIGTGANFCGGLSTWEDAEGTRWILAPVWGAVSEEFAKLTSSGRSVHGALAAFRVEEHDGKPMLTPVWMSRDMPAPQPPVITAGTAFVLSAGEYSRDGKPKASTHATLYALDAATGKEVYSSGNQVTAPGALTGLTIANARVYFTTTDNTLYAFGIFLER